MKAVLYFLLLYCGVNYLANHLQRGNETPIEERKAEIRNNTSPPPLHASIVMRRPLSRMCTSLKPILDSTVQTKNMSMRAIPFHKLHVWLQQPNAIACEPLHALCLQYREGFVSQCRRDAAAANV
jgi:hypothetical protein